MTRTSWSRPMGNEFATLDREKPCAERSARRTATPRPWWTGESRR